MKLDIGKALKGYPVRKGGPYEGKDSLIKDNAERIAEILAANGVVDDKGNPNRLNLYNARGNVSLPGGGDIFAVVAYLDGEIDKQSAADAGKAPVKVAASKE